MKNKNIGFIGHHPIFFGKSVANKEMLDFAKAFVELKEEQNSPTVIVVDEPEQQPTQRVIEVNGVQYVEKQKPKTNSRPRSMMLDMYVEQFVDMFHKEQRQLPDHVNIVTEYGLIQNKASKLSKWDRDVVVSIFELRYVKL